MPARGVCRGAGGVRGDDPVSAGGVAAPPRPRAGVGGGAPQQPATGLIAQVLAQRCARAWRRERPPAGRRTSSPAARSWACRCCCRRRPASPACSADRQPPPVLFAKGDLGVLEGRRVAVVARAALLRGGGGPPPGLGLGAAGVHVVSGLARVDGVAQCPAGAEGEGRRGRRLAGWTWCTPASCTCGRRGNCGLLLSDAPGIGPEPFRSRCATGSSPPSPRSWWWWRAAKGRVADHCGRGAGPFDPGDGGARPAHQPRRRRHQLVAA